MSTSTTMNICQRVRTSCDQWMATRGNDHVQIHNEALHEVARNIQQQSQVLWDEEAWHYQPPTTNVPPHIRHERIALYILALDAINFCFWPSTHSYEYVDLACTLTAMASADHDTLSNNHDNNHDNYLLAPTQLAHMTVDQMTQLFQNHHPKGHAPPDMDRRCDMWNELGSVLLQKFDGSAMTLIESAQGSAVQLVQVLFDHFLGFRDVATGTDPITADDPPPPKVYFLKRAQICVGDLQAALPDSLTTSLWSRNDMDQITTFADYRLPQLLRHWKVLEYSPALAQLVDAQQELSQGSDSELSIRAATVVTVERLVQQLQQLTITTTKNANESTTNNQTKWTAVQVDWYLWQVGEKMEGAGALKPHHRVRTIYY